MTEAALSWGSAHLGLISTFLALIMRYYCVHDLCELGASFSFRALLLRLLHCPNALEGLKPSNLRDESGQKTKSHEPEIDLKLPMKQCPKINICEVTFCRNTCWQKKKYLVAYDESIFFSYQDNLKMIVNFLQNFYLTKSIKKANTSATFFLV